MHSPMLLLDIQARRRSFPVAYAAELVINGGWLETLVVITVV